MRLTTAHSFSFKMPKRIHTGSTLERFGESGLRDLHSMLPNFADRHGGGKLDPEKGYKASLKLQMSDVQKVRSPRAAWAPLRAHKSFQVKTGRWL